jgi:glyoxylase-like metal-dependent hydrolase (beta-lactamase superfamily II)
MRPAPSRRDFLRISLGAAAALSIAPRAASGAALQASATRAGVTSATLADTLTHVSGAGGNVVALRGPDGLVLANAGGLARTADLLAVLGQEFPGARVSTVFNTDWHPDHTGGNEALAGAGGQIIAHEHTKQYLGSDIFVDWEERTYPARPAQALPTKTFYTTGELVAGDERIRYGHLGQAHTDSDIYVFFTKANVLVAGDVVSVGRYPIADYTTGGWLGGLATATKTLLDLTNDATRIVPGSGPVQTRADVQAQHEMLAALRDRIGKMMRQGLSASDMLAAGITEEFDARWGDPSLFLATAYRGMWLHVRELGGIV